MQNSKVIQSNMKKSKVVLEDKSSPNIKTRSYIKSNNYCSPRGVIENLPPLTCSQGRKILTPNKTPISSGNIVKNKGKDNNKETIKLNTQLIHLKEENGKLNAQTKILSDENKRIKIELNKCNAKLDILGPTWIADETLATYLDIIMTKVVGDSGNVYLVNPCIGHAIKSLNDFKDLLAPLPLSGADIIIIPINDYVEQRNDVAQGHSNYDQGGHGSHWSVLVFNKSKLKFYYYDSLKNFNLEAANIVANKIADYFSLSLKPDMLFFEGPTQKNSYDCGVYSIMFIDYILINSHTSELFTELAIPDFTNLQCLKKRSYVAYIILNGYTMNKQEILALMYGKNGSKIKEGKNICNNEGTTINNNKAVADVWAVNNKPSRARRRSNSEQTQRNYKNKATEENILPLFNKFGILTGDSKIGNDVPKVTNQSIAKPVHTPCPTQIPTSNKVSDKVKNNCSTKGTYLNNMTLVSDSQGKDLINCQQVLMGVHTNLFGHVQPGAPLETVVKTAVDDLELRSYGEDDWIVVIGGCNDVANDNTDDYVMLSKKIQQCLHETIQIFKKTNLIIASIPYRYDLNHNNKSQKLLQKINKDIRQLSHQYPNVYLLDLYLLERRFHTNQGFHINRKGKIYISKLIKSIILNKQEHRNKPFTRTRNAERNSTGCSSTPSEKATDVSTPLTSPWCGWSTPNATTAKYITRQQGTTCSDTTYGQLGSEEVLVQKGCGVDKKQSNCVSDSQFESGYSLNRLEDVTNVMSRSSESHKSGLDLVNPEGLELSELFSVTEKTSDSSYNVNMSLNGS